MQALTPRSLAEALELRAAHPDAIAVAGGTDLMVELNKGQTPPAALLDLSRVVELHRWHGDEHSFVVGAGVTFATIAAELTRLTALAQAARMVGSAQIRNRATLGGNLATASPAGDSLPVIAAYDARIQLASACSGTRIVPWREFFVGPKQTTLRSDELIVAVEFDTPRGPGSFAKVGPRGAMVIAVAALCLQLDERDRSVRVGLGSVGPTVLRATNAEGYAATVVRWDDPRAAAPAVAEIEEFGRRAAEAAAPIDDLRGSAAYRQHVVDHLSRRALRWALDDRRAA